MEDLNKLKALHEEVCTAVASREWYWYNLADDYQTKYSSSSDYDKSYKRTYREKGRVCQRAASELRNLTFPAAPTEIPPFVASVKTLLNHLPDFDKRQAETFLPKMEEIAEKYS